MQDVIGKCLLVRFLWPVLCLSFLIYGRMPLKGCGGAGAKYLDGTIPPLGIASGVSFGASCLGTFSGFLQQLAN